eukprot:397026-Rhodomonas_salina.1
MVLPASISLPSSKKKRLLDSEPVTSPTSLRYPPTRGMLLCAVLYERRLCCHVLYGTDFGENATIVLRAVQY